MKKLLLLFFLVFTLSSCYVNVKKSVVTPSKETTTYLQGLPKDSSVSVAYEEHTIYVFDKKSNLLIYKAESLNSEAIPIHWMGIIFLIFFMLGIGIGIGAE